MSTSLLERLQVAKFARAVAQMSNGLQEAVVQNGAFASSAAALIRGAAAVHERFAEALLATTSGLRSTSCSVSVQNPAQQCSTARGGRDGGPARWRRVRLTLDCAASSLMDGARMGRGFWLRSGCVCAPCVSL